MGLPASASGPSPVVGSEACVFPSKRVVSGYRLAGRLQAVGSLSVASAAVKRAVMSSAAVVLLGSVKLQIVASVFWTPPKPPGRRFIPLPILPAAPIAKKTRKTAPEVQTRAPRRTYNATPSLDAIDAPPRYQRRHIPKCAYISPHIAPSSPGSSPPSGARARPRARSRTRGCAPASSCRRPCSRSTG